MLDITVYIYLYKYSNSKIRKLQFVKDQKIQKLQDVII